MTCYDDYWNSAACDVSYPPVAAGSLQFMPGVQVWGTINTNADGNCWRYNWVTVVGAGNRPLGNPYDSAVAMTTQYGGYTGWVYFRGVPPRAAEASPENGAASPSRRARPGTCTPPSFHYHGLGTAAAP